MSEAQINEIMAIIAEGQIDYAAYLELELEDWNEDVSIHIPFEAMGDEF
jgi:hypothetical protein